MSMVNLPLSRIGVGTETIMTKGRPGGDVDMFRINKNLYGEFKKREKE